ncbi:hypothetical protein [Morganella morganii IS15]|nr:hypothetical protein CSB69_0978 [Morganella morganii]CDK66969.1 hypothetical protein [Morganella morganii IS15]
MNPEAVEKFSVAKAFVIFRKVPGKFTQFKHGNCRFFAENGLQEKR